MGPGYLDQRQMEDTGELYMGILEDHWEEWPGRAGGIPGGGRSRIEVKGPVLVPKDELLCIYQNSIWAKTL